jgi:ABC transporter substrate binding protein (PQQ-dependent alcohol dehydrogenase system)
MTSRRLLAFAAVFAAFLSPSAWAQAPAPAGQPPAAPFTIGYVDLAEDPRYDEDYAYARIQLRPLGRAISGAELGIADGQQIGKVIGLDFSLEHVTGGNAEEIAAALRDFAARGVHFVIVDLPAPTLLEVADAVAGEQLLLFNATAPDDNLRGADCRANLAHIYPSYTMLTDALGQYLALRQWTDILVLKGPLPEDEALATALERSAVRFGLRITEERPFALTNDPRRRDESNIPLLTAGADYDVAYVADTDGEFGRYVPYQTNDPRPVVGTAGLVADAWHWAWERQGAPQVNSRFEAIADRRMTGQDWGAWVAVKAIVQGVLRSKSTEFEAVRDYLFSDRLNLDGSKGNPMSFRAWDYQLRQPLLLTTPNAVIERPPIEGFLHQVNDLDTLGVDQPETQCSM